MYQEPLTHNPTSWFFSTTRPKNDTVKQDQEAVQNSNAMSWQTTQWNEQTDSCSMHQTIGLATGFPALNYTGNYGSTAVGGCDINLYSRLKLGDEGTFRVKGNQQLFPRPWATTPNMGGGPSASDKDTESYLWQAAPMIPELRSEMHDVNTYVEQWTRGGEASRLNVKNRVLN